MSNDLYTPSQHNANYMLSTGQNIFITGKPGTGKTKLINDFCEREISAGKKVLLTASTGLAATNLEQGKTIHSVLRWNPNKKIYNYDECTALLKQSDILVIDEVSMLGNSILKHLDECLRRLDKKLQVVMCGDFFQLPPVTKRGDLIYYPFESIYWDNLNLHPCVLQEVVRQQNREYVYMLHLAMAGDTRCLKYFNEKTQKDEIEGAIVLCTKNKFADELNEDSINKLPGKSRIYTAKGEVLKANFKNSRILKQLEIKEGMRVMALRNDPQGKYQNGSLGTVVDMEENSIKVLFDNKNLAEIHRCTFDVDQTDGSLESVKVEQFPVRGGYAITIHKSQGQTFDAVNIMASGCWAPGQLYVALSRVRTVEGIHLMVPLKGSDLETNIKVINYYKRLAARVA